MKQWLVLTAKEYRMNSRTFAVQFILLVTCMFLLSFLSQYKHIGLIMLPAFFIMVLAALFPCQYIYKSVSREIKVTPHLWLHCPLPAWVLLSSKLAVGLAGMIVILLLNLGFISWGHYFFYSLQGGVAGSPVLISIYEIGTPLIIGVIIIGLYLAVSTMLAIIVNVSLKYRLGSFYWLTGLGAFVVLIRVLTYLSKGPVYQYITRWSDYKVHLSSIPSAQDFTGQITYGKTSVSIIILAILIFALSAWLLDHKVEV